MSMNLSDPQSLFESAQQALLRGEIASAELMLEQANELAGEGSNLYAAGLAVLMVIQGREDESLDLLNDKLGDNPEDATLLLAFGMTMEKTGDLEGAEDAYREALKYDDENPGALHGLAVRLQARGEKEEAEKLACKAFHKVPEHPVFALTAAKLLEECDKPDLAFQVAELGAAYNPDEEELVRRAVEGALQRQMPDRAWELLQESNPENPWVAGWKATLLDLDGKPEEADALIEKSMAVAGNDTTYLFLVACIYLRREDPRTAELVQRILEIDPGHGGAFRLQAELAADDVEEVLRPLAKAYEASQDAMTGWELVASYYATGRYLDALDLAEQLRDDPDMPSTLYPTFTMLCHAALDEPEEALDFIEELPFEMAIAALGEMDKHGSGSEAEAKVRKLLEEKFAEEAPEVQPWEVVADHYIQGRYQDCYDQCQELDRADNALDRLFLAYNLLSLAALGRTDEARAGVPKLPLEMVDSVLTEMASFGAGNEAEKEVRELLTERLEAEPEAPAPVPLELPPGVFGPDEEFEWVEVDEDEEFDDDYLLDESTVFEEVTLDNVNAYHPPPPPPPAPEDELPDGEVIHTELDPDDDEYEYVWVEVDEEEETPAEALPGDGWDGHDF
ncbi:MAG: hypothetical protein AB7S38_32260 [Vulcanimicrobiota bacterium]